MPSAGFVSMRSSGRLERGQPMSMSGRRLHHHPIVLRNDPARELLLH